MEKTVNHGIDELLVDAHMVSHTTLELEPMVLQHSNVERSYIVGLCEDAVQVQSGEGDCPYEDKKAGEIFCVRRRMFCSLRLQEKGQLSPPSMPIDIGQTAIPDAYTLL